MSKMIQVRHVPDRVHRELVRRAEQSGVTLTQYIEDILEREVARPPLRDVLARIRTRQRVTLPGPAADLVRLEREERDGP